MIVSGSYSDTTDGAFTIRGTTIGSLTMPAAGTSLYVGSPYSVAWVSPKTTAYVDIDLIVGSTTRNIVTKLADFSSYRMLMPALTGAGAILQITFHSAAGTVLNTAQVGSLNIYQNPLQPVTIVASAGTPQTENAGAFVTQLQALVRDANSNPVVNAAVTFTAPSAGASGTFSGNPSATVSTNASGVAVAPVFTPNGTAGTYSVIATTPVSSAIATFTLTNTTPVALTFMPITPCRVADTRLAAGPFGGPSISGGTTRNFTIPSSACSIPSTAQAYSLNVTAVPPAPLGYLTVWPAGQPQPIASTLNSDGRVKANAAIVPAGTSGAVSFFASNTTDVVIDINGYFIASSNTGLLYNTLTPCRIADTRNPNGPLGGPYLAGGIGRTFPIRSSACGIPGVATAYSLNMTVVPHGSLGYLTTWPTGQTRPVASTLNAQTGTTTSNAALVLAGTSGSVDVFASNDSDFVIDIDGYFVPQASGGYSLYSLPPCRAFDDRLPAGSPPFSGTMTVAISASGCGAPANAKAFVLNATVVPQGGLGYLTMWASGAAQPAVSTLNASDGVVAGNLALVPNTTGSVNAFASNSTYLILDIFGYFAP